LTYQLGIDFGTTFTAAAVAQQGRVRVFELGNRSAVIPTVVLVRDDDEFLTGEAAERRAISEPEHVAREFKRRLGDPTPLLLGGRPYSAEQLQSRILRSVLAQVTEREGGPPDKVAVTRPANWGPYKLDLFEQALRLAGIEDALLLTEPEAAAIHYASQERVAEGALVAVYDLGGGTFDAAVLRKTADGFELRGRPEGIERLGGIDFDEAMFGHVVRALGGTLGDLDPDDSAVASAVARLRQECVEAKEALSADTEATIPVVLPNVQTEVRITRAEFEALIRSPLADTIEALRRALRSAQVEPEDLSAVLLVGGSSRIPLVAQLVTAELGRPVAVDAHPKHGVAMGAALAAATARGAQEP
jgi:molecular chaperone DnaK